MKGLKSSVVNRASALIVLSFLAANTAQAAIVQLTTVPSSWKLENYLNHHVVVWYAGTACTNGKLTLPSTATRDDRNLFWSTVMAAKVANARLFVRYDDATPNCEIRSYGLPQE